MHWAAAYLGKPWRIGADGPDAFDCWGLVRAVLRTRAGVELQPIVFADVRELITAFSAHPEHAAWRRVGEPRELDAVLMSQARHPIHVGLWVDADGGRVLHACRPAVVVQDAIALKAQGYKIHGFYRHQSA